MLESLKARGLEMPEVGEKKPRLVLFHSHGK